MKSFLILFVLIAQLVAAQPTPVFFMGPGNVETDTALWRKHKLRSATVTDTYGSVRAYFQVDSQNHIVVAFNQNTLTQSTYHNNRVVAQAVHKSVSLGYLDVRHEIDSLFYIHINDSTVVIRKKQYQLGSARNQRNADINEKWYLMRWEDVDWGGLTYIAYSYPFFARTPWSIYTTYPNGAFRVPRYDGQYVLEDKFKTNYIDTGLYCIKQSEEVRVKDSTVSLTETVEPDVAFTPPAQYFQPWTCGYHNYHPSDNQFYTTSESKYDDNGLLIAIESKTYRTSGQFSPTSVLVSSNTEYRFAYTFFDR